MGEKRDYTIIRREYHCGFPSTYTFGDNPSLTVAADSPNPFILEKDGTSYVIDPSSIRSISIKSPGLFSKGYICLHGFYEGILKYTCEGKDVQLSFDIKRKDDYSLLYILLNDNNYNVGLV